MQKTVEPYCFETEREETWHNVGFEKGYEEAIEKVCKYLKETKRTLDYDVFSYSESLLSDEEIETLRSEMLKD